jgi:hypothetical protein
MKAPQKICKFFSCFCFRNFLQQIDAALGTWFLSFTAKQKNGQFTTAA